MKILSQKIHGIIDFLVVLFLLSSPTLFGFTGLLAYFTYSLGIVHLLLTLLTDFNSGVIKIIPLPIHGLIELLVGVVLVVLAYTLFKGNEMGKVFYTIFGIAVLVVWLITDYGQQKDVN